VQSGVAIRKRNISKVFSGVTISTKTIWETSASRLFSRSLRKKLARPQIGKLVADAAGSETTPGQQKINSSNYKP
jgi:hypothetical protein